MGLDSKTLPEAFLSKLSKAQRKPLGKAGRTASECQDVQVAKSERELQNQIESLLRRRGYLPARQRMDRKSNLAKGMPDFFFSVNGCAVYWEVKFGKGSTSPEQDSMLLQLTQYPNKAFATLIFTYQHALDCLKSLERTCYAVRP